MWHVWKMFKSHPQYLGTAPMNKLTEVIRTIEYQWNYNWVRRRKMNLLRILKILKKKWGIQSCRFQFSLWLGRICSLIMISATEQTLLKRGCNNICGWSKILVRTSDITIFIVVVRFFKNTLRTRKKVPDKDYYFGKSISLLSVCQKIHLQEQHEESC